MLVTETTEFLFPHFLILILMNLHREGGMKRKLLGTWEPFQHLFKDRVTQSELVSRWPVAEKPSGCTLTHQPAVRQTKEYSNPQGENHPNNI
jgi:hypothetical protein